MPEVIPAFNLAIIVEVSSCINNIRYIKIAVFFCFIGKPVIKSTNINIIEYFFLLKLICAKKSNYKVNIRTNVSSVRLNLSIFVAYSQNIF